MSPTEMAYSFAICLLATEMYRYLPTWAKTIVRKQAARLPARLRERLNEEWLRHVEDIPGNIAKFVFAISQMRAVPALRYLDRTQLPYRPWSDLAIRVLDIVVSLAALILIFPTFLLVSVMIKATSRGPVLSRQRRIGQFGREFDIMSFRTMRVGGPEIFEGARRSIGGHEIDRMAGVCRFAHDPRFTPLGWILRKTALADWPQFLNVFRGDMSMVGPRPARPSWLAHYDSRHYQQLELKPGITGIGPVMYGLVTFDECARMDLEYARNRSFWLHIKILWWTVRKVLEGDHFRPDKQLLPG